MEEEVEVTTRRKEETEAPTRLEDGEEPTTWMEEEEASAPGLDDVDESPTAEVHSREPVNWPPPCHSASKLHKKSFIDDLTLLEKVSLSQLIEKKRIIGPLNYHDRFNLTLPHNRSILQHQVGDLQIFTKERHMKLNNKKTKCIPFNNSLTKDFMPQIWIEDNEALEVIYQLKLVGLVINSALNWTDHVDYTIGRVNKILWQITRFRQLGAPREKLITLYILKVRSVLMFGAVAFHSSLTQELSSRIELQQKKALKIILGSQYRSYSNALLLTDLPRLDTLRAKACLQWAIKSQLNPKHSDLFPLNNSIENTRNKKKFKEYRCHTVKFFNSAIPSMTRSLNEHFASKANQQPVNTP